MQIAGTNIDHKIAITCPWKTW